MPRRASSGMSPAVLFGILAFALIAFFGGKALLSKKSPTGISGSTLEMDTLKRNSNSLRGNEYVVEGTIDEKLRWTPDRGQVISLKVPTPGGDEFVSIHVPQELSDINIEREQRYAFKVRFRQGGIAVAEQISRL